MEFLSTNEQETQSGSGWEFKKDRATWGIDMRHMQPKTSPGRQVRSRRAGGGHRQLLCVPSRVVSSLDFECTACNTKVLTTGSGCPTKSLESKFGFGKAKFGGKGVARRAWNRRNSSGSGSAHHIPLHVTNLRMAIRSRLPGKRSMIGP